jgi:uncharacterized protein involved in exopolysaccharide biosynthesis
VAHDIIPTNPFVPGFSQEESLGLGETVKQIFPVIFKWNRLIFSLGLAFALAAGVAMYLKPPVRKAVAKILLKSDRLTLQISGLRGLNVKPGYSTQIMQSEVEVVKSREVLAPVAERLLLAKKKPGEKLREDDVDAKIDSLRRNVIPSALPDTNVMQVTFFAPTVKEAETTLGLVVDKYMEQHALTSTGSEKLLKFYEQEKERVAVDLKAAEERLRKWQEANHVVSIDEQISRQLEAVVGLEKALQTKESDIEAARAKLSALRAQSSSHPERLVTAREQVRNPLIAKLKGDLAGAEVALQDLLQRYTEKDRRVQEKKEQIAFLKEQLSTAETEGDITGREVTALNPVREVLDKDLMATQALLTSLGPQREILRGQFRLASADLLALREKKLEVSRMSRLVELQKDTFMLHSKNLEEARLAAGLDKEHLGNASLIEQPHATDDSDFTKRVGLVALAAIVGTALGMAIALCFEFFSRTLRTRDDVEHYLELPVLAVIPDLREHQFLLGATSRRGVLPSS